MPQAPLGPDRMITVNAGGHSSYLTTPSTCSDNATTAFLLGGPLLRDLRCEADAGTRIKSRPVERRLSR